MKTKNRIKELDGLRGIAILTVVIFHYFYRYNDLYNHIDVIYDWANYGQYGVWLFFIISGFVIYSSLDRVSNSLAFIYSRFIRLYPAYWFCVVITFTVVSFFGLDGREVTLSDMLINLSMLQMFIGVPHVDGAYWSLTVELIFYFWIFILLKSKSVDKIEIFLVLFLAISFICKVYIPDVNKYFKFIVMVEYSPLFCLGVSLYLFFINQRRIINSCVSFFSVAVLIIDKSADVQLVMLIVVSLFIAGVNGYISVLRSKVLLFFGYISYPFYLLHQNVGYVILNMLYEINVNGYIAVVLTFLFLVFLSWITTSYIEKPIRNRVNVIFEYLNNKKTSIVGS